MPTWNEINSEILSLNSTNACDTVRRKYLEKLEDRVKRPVIAYYSGFLQKKNPDGTVHPECAITDLDMNGFMSVVHNLERNKGLDLILHTPGGGVEATRSIVEYLYKMFGSNIRVVVPHMAMSAGTMIACAAQEIVLGKHSCLGPTDPQVRGLPAMGVMAEVEKAIEEIKNDPARNIVYQHIFSKFTPAFLRDCNRSIKHSEEMVQGWLAANMFEGEPDPEATAAIAVKGLMDYEGTSGHGHHFLADKCKEMGLKIIDLEGDQELQEDVLSVHHTFVATFTYSKSLKVIENSRGADWNISG
ncbi:MAG: SDH family Clp fold serine proteinase [Pseudooceanicola atlanticus]